MVFLIMFIFLIGFVVSCWGIMKGNEDVWVNVAIIVGVCLVLTIMFSFVAKVDRDYEKIPRDEIEIARTENHVVIIEKHGEQQIFRSHKHYKGISDETEFYYERVYNSWGGEIEEKIVPDYEKD